MIVVKDHEIISFKQNKWLERYISFNIQKRKKAENKFEKGSFKLVNIGNFCKMLEEIRNRFKKSF